MYQLTVKTLFAEGVGIVLAGLAAGWLYNSWKAVIITQGAFLACEGAGYAIEGWLRRRREQRS